MNNMIWDAVLWLRKKLNKDKEDIIVAVNNIQNLFETSADATASPSDILEGQTAYNGTVLLTGNMKDRRGVTVTAGAVTQDENYTYLSIPEEACYNANSKVRTPNSNLPQVADGTFVGVLNTVVTVNVGFKPDRISIAAEKYNNANAGIYYYPYAKIAFTSGSYNAEVNITDTGFTYKATNGAEVQKHYYTAVKL